MMGLNNYKSRWTLMYEMDVSAEPTGEYKGYSNFANIQFTGTTTEERGLTKAHVSICETNAC